jgi:hypothetical protein
LQSVVSSRCISLTLSMVIMMYIAHFWIPGSESGRPRQQPPHT